MTEYSAKLNTIANSTDSYLKKIFSKQKDKSSLTKPMKYGVFSGGKRFRSAIVVNTGKLFKINYKKHKGPPKKEREQILIQFIKDYKSTGVPLDIAYMYYDYETNGDVVNLVVTNSNEYHPDMKECVRHIIR